MRCLYLRAKWAELFGRSQVACCKSTQNFECLVVLTARRGFDSWFSPEELVLGKIELKCPKLKLIKLSIDSEHLVKTAF